jgi:uncharacterized protein YjbI with pentapeptide repeats
MDPVVESALISAVATFVGVGGTVIVAIAGFRNSRLANKATIDAAEKNTNTQVSAALAANREAIDRVLEGQLTDRYTKAIEQLGSDKLDVRIGGIYALERVARDSIRDHPTVVEVLTAFIREHSHDEWPSSGPEGQEPARSIRPDLQAAITVVVRRDIKRDIRPIDLIGADLTGTDLSNADFTRADLVGADLTGADLSHVSLAEAKLRSANLTRAKLIWADLIGADLSHANLTGARLYHAKLNFASLDCADLTHTDFELADLTSASLTRANLTRAGLKNATLTGAFFIAADLTSARLPDADLTDANFGPEGTDHATLRDANLNGVKLRNVWLRDTDLTGAYLLGADLTGTNFAEANLTGVSWPYDEDVPSGWKRGTDLGRLERACTGSEPAK